MTLKDKLIMYIYQKSNSIDNEYFEHLEYLRYKNNDEVDYLESLIRLVRKRTFDEVSYEILGLMFGTIIDTDKKI